MHNPIPILIRPAPLSVRPIAPITTPADPAAFAAGVAAGANMCDEEALRYTNMMIAALNDPEARLYTNPQVARRSMPYWQDRLAACDMVASIGYAGTAIIRPLRREQVAA